MVRFKNKKWYLLSEILFKIVHFQIAPTSVDHFPDDSALTQREIHPPLSRLNLKVFSASDSVYSSQIRGKIVSRLLGRIFACRNY